MPSVSLFQARLAHNTTPVRQLNDPARDTPLLTRRPHESRIVLVNRLPMWHFLHFTTNTVSAVLSTTHIEIEGG